MEGPPPGGPSAYRGRFGAIASGYAFDVRLALVLSLLVMLVPAAAAGTSRTAYVTVPSKSPVTVRGTRFLPNEIVRVTVSASSTRIKKVTANARGAFRTTFRGFSIKYCEPYTVRAKGNRGSLATVNVIPDCPNAFEP